MAVGPRVGERAAAWSGAEVNSGTPLTLDNFKGQAVLVYFFATWCPYCRAEIPDIQAQFVSSGNKLKVVAIAVQADSAREVRAIAQRLGLTFPTVFDGDEAATDYQIVGVPTRFFLDRKGVVRTRLTGALTREQRSRLFQDADKA